jgi:mannose-6-phosphate isomerase
MGDIPILEFEPILKSTVWGGRKLGDRLGKTLPGDGPFGESWELVDLPGDQSIVSSGSLKGKTLESLLKDFGDEILGSASLLDGRFPLLFKFIDAGDTLSVQVHPDQNACARLGGGARPKTEAWYVIESSPGSALARAVESGKVEDLLNRVEVKRGDFVFLPSGTVHAIGKGILLAEIQQSSDTTYRVFDWNRVGLDGKPRQLHVTEALKSIAFGSFGLPDWKSPRSGLPGIACDDFVVELRDLDDADQALLEGAGPLVVMGVDGKGEMDLVADCGVSTLKAGQTRLVPAVSAGSVRLLSRGGNSVLSVRISQ